MVTFLPWEVPCAPAGEGWEERDYQLAMEANLFDLLHLLVFDFP
jgi:hypothetical protein